MKFKKIDEDKSSEAIDAMAALRVLEDDPELSKWVEGMAEEQKEEYIAKSTRRHNRSHPTRILLLRRQEYALRLRCSNPVITYEEVARLVRERFGLEKYNISQAQADVMLALEPVRRNIAQFAVEFIALDAMRLEEMFQRVWGVAFDDEDDTVDLKAVDRLLKIQQRRAKTLGVDNPDLVTLAAMTRHTEGDGEDAKFINDSDRVAALVALLGTGKAAES